MASVSTQNIIVMIYLNHRFFSAPRTDESGIPRRPATAGPWVLAAAALVLLLGTAGRNVASSGGDRPSAMPLEQEQRHLQGFMDALRAEGAVRRLSPCREADVCAGVTELFRSLDASDQRSIGRGIARYFETRTTDARPVREVRFLDARTGIELGRYAGGRLLWEGDF